MGCSASLPQYTKSRDCTCGAQQACTAGGSQREESIARRTECLALAERVFAATAGKKFHDLYVRATLVSYGASARVLVADHLESSRRVAVKVITKVRPSPGHVHAHAPPRGSLC
jgi:hypothetical protein